MATGDDYRLQCTVAAMKLLLGRLYALQYEQMHIEPSLVPDMHKTAISNWSKAPIIRSSDGLAVSEAVSTEILDELKTFLHEVEKDYQTIK